jgi:hypothetical protein
VPTCRVDPINPRLQAWELRDGEYVEVTGLTGDDEWAGGIAGRRDDPPSDLVL